ncbi:MAG: IS1595 family transposase [Terracidiphilus sp.]
MSQTQVGKDLTLLSVTSRFSTEEAAIRYFEQIRWPDGPFCPHCGNADAKRLYSLTANKAKKIRLGLYKCAECRESFTVRVGTVMEDSHVPLNKWLIGFYMMCASKTQVSALQLQRQLEIGSYNTALFLCQRIRFALMDLFPHSKLGGTIEADETYIGGRIHGKGRAYKGNKTPVVSLVERGGRVRSRVVDSVTGRAITQLLKDNAAATGHLNTDESPLYVEAGREFTSHDRVNHSEEEYARFDRKTGRLASTNTVEGFFGNSKRSIDGTHHHISRKHTALYFAELDHKYNTRKLTDGERTVQGIKGMEGKRLMLRTPKSGDATVLSEGV